MAAEAKRQERNRAANTWTLRGQDHNSAQIESNHDFAQSNESSNWSVGTRVEALYQAQTHGSRRCSWYPGTIASEADAEGRCDVQYDDGDVETHVPAVYLRLLGDVLPSPATAATGDRRGDEQRGSSAQGGSKAEAEETARENAREKPAESSGREPRPVRSASARVPRHVQASDDAGGLDTQERARGMGEGHRLVGGEEDDGGSDSQENYIDWGETSDDASDEDYQG